MNLMFNDKLINIICLFINLINILWQNGWFVSGCTIAFFNQHSRSWKSLCIQKWSSEFIVIIWVHSVYTWVTEMNGLSAWVKVVHFNRTHTLNTGFCIDVDDFNWVLFNREPCQGTRYWRAAYFMVDLVMQWLDLVISMEIIMKVCCDRYFIAYIHQDSIHVLTIVVFAKGTQSCQMVLCRFPFTGVNYIHRTCARMI